MIILFHVGPTVVLVVGHLVTAVTHGQGCGDGGGGAAAVAARAAAVLDRVTILCMF